MSTPTNPMFKGQQYQQAQAAVQESSTNGRGTTARVENYESAQVSGGGFDFTALDAPVSTNLGSEASEEFKRVATAFIAAQKQGNAAWNQTFDNYGYLMLTRETGLAYDSHVFWMRTRDGLLSTYIVGLVVSGDQYGKAMVRIGNNEFEDLLTASSVVDEEMKTIIFEAMSAQGITKAADKRFLAGYTAVPVSFEINRANEVKVLRLCSNAANAILSQLTTSLKDNRRLADVAGDQTLKIEIDPKPMPTVDETDLPLNADIMITFTVGQADNDRNRQQSRNSRARSMVFSRVGGYMDPVYWPEREQTNRYAVRRSREESNRMWVHNYVVKTMNSDASNSLVSTLMGLYSTLALHQNKNYLPSYLPTRMPANGELDLKNIGAFGVYANFDSPETEFGSPVDIYTQDFSQQDYGYYIDSIFHDRFQVTVDMPTTGPRAWRMNDFEKVVVSAKGNDYRNRIVNAFDRYTGGAFRDYFKDDMNMFEHWYDIHTGTYVDRLGQRKDIDSIMNSIALANYFTSINQPERLFDYTDIVLRTDIDPVYRLKGYREIADDATGYSVTWTGNSIRGVLSEDFMYALGKSIGECGLTFDIRAGYDGNDYNRHRATASYLNGRQRRPDENYITTNRRSGGGGSRRSYAELYDF